MLCREHVALLQLSQGQSRTCFHSRLSPGRIWHIWVLWLGTHNHPLGLAAAGGATGAIGAIHKAHQAPHSKGSAVSLTTHTWNATSALDCEPETSGYPSSCEKNVATWQFVWYTYVTYTCGIVKQRLILCICIIYKFYMDHETWSLFPSCSFDTTRLSNDVELWLYGWEGS